MSFFQTINVFFRAERVKRAYMGQILDARLLYSAIQYISFHAVFSSTFRLASNKRNKCWFTQELGVLPHWACHSVIKLTCAVWGWSALTVAGLWSGEESRVWRALTHTYYNHCLLLSSLLLLPAWMLIERLLFLIYLGLYSSNGGRGELRV